MLKFNRTLCILTRVEGQMGDGRDTGKTGHQPHETAGQKSLGALGGV